MFRTNICRHPGCMKIALSHIDENGVLSETGDYCYKHTPIRDKIKKDIINYIINNDKIVGLNASGITFTDINLTNKKFYGCCFQHCFFTNIRAYNGLRSRMSCFDFSIFTDCILAKTNIQFTSFAGSRFINVLLKGSDLIQNNFCGIQAYQTSFDNSDLYSSSFIKGNFSYTSFYNCNIKKTIFYDIKQQNVNFKLSNTNEAVFDKEGSALFTGDNKKDRSKEETQVEMFEVL